MTTGIFDLKVRNNVRPTLLTLENAPSDITDATNKYYVDNAISTAVAAKSITLTGDITGTGTSSITATLPNIVTAGNYAAVRVNAKGQVISGATLTVTGDATGTTTTNSIALTLANSGVTAGTYTGAVTVNAKGIVTGGAALLATDVSTALGYTPIGPSGGTITGNLSVSGILSVSANPTQTNQVVNKQYVDSKVWLALAVGL